MRQLIQYIRSYTKETNKTLLVLVTLFMAMAVCINYQAGLDHAIRENNSRTVKLFSRYAVFGLAFGIPYFIRFILRPVPPRFPPLFIFLVLVAPLLFALKMNLDPVFRFAENPAEDQFWNHIVYWPLLCLMMTAVLFITWKMLDKDQPFYGIKTRGIRLGPYFGMLLIMLPLVALASTRPDFLAVYPKLNVVLGAGSAGDLAGWKILLYELAYGSDFFSIELFFRGFLVLAFVKWAGKDAILPMACFYCAIHFGKPAGECISSYFGGIFLGIVVYHTRSIIGGLVAHLGIAWMMEAGGYLGNL